MYEVDTAGWEPRGWEDEVERMREFIDPAAATLIYWQPVGGKLVRTCIAGRFA